MKAQPLLIGAFGATDVDYAIEVFNAFPEEEQPHHQRALTEALPLPNDADALDL